MGLPFYQLFFSLLLLIFSLFLAVEGALWGPVSQTTWSPKPGAPAIFLVWASCTLLLWLYHDGVGSLVWAVCEVQLQQLWVLWLADLWCGLLRDLCVPVRGILLYETGPPGQGRGTWKGLQCWQRMPAGAGSTLEGAFVLDEGACQWYQGRKPLEGLGARQKFG